MESFDDAISKHKNNLIENLSQFNEGHRVRGLLMDIESNKSDYEYYFNAGQQSKQSEIDELKKRIDDALNEIESGITGKHHVKSIINILKGNTNEH